MKTQIGSHHRNWADLLKDIQEQVLALLFVRYVFGTVQEIFRENKKLHPVSSTFSLWTQLVYVSTNCSTIRRLAGQSYGSDDVSLVRLMDMMMLHPEGLPEIFEPHFPVDLAESRKGLRDKGWVESSEEESLACKRLVGVDRKLLLSKTKKITDWASKRIAHHNMAAENKAMYIELEDSTEIVKALTEKYLLLVYDRKFDLRHEMKIRKLRKGWEKLFLKKWATQAILNLPLGERQPPKVNPS